LEEGTDEFERVYKAYYGDVFKAVYHKTSDRQTAEDITQDTFVAAFKLGEEFLAHPQRREALCRAARETGEEYSAQRFAERVEAIYLEQIERNAVRRIPA